MHELQQCEPTDEAYIKAMATIDRKIIQHNLSIDMENCNMHYAREFLKVIDKETELGFLKSYKQREAKERLKLLESTKKLDASKMRKLELHQPTTNAIKREMALNIEVETLKLRLEENRISIHQLKGSSHCNFILRPSRFPNEGAETKVESKFHWMPCAFFKSSFLAKDVILAPCMCLYHPWCIVM